METISGLAELRAKAECHLRNFGAVKLHVLSSRLPEVGLSGWGGSLQCIRRAVLQPVLHCVKGCLSRLTEGPQHYAQKQQHTGKRHRVNRDKTGMTLLLALKASVQLPSALERWHLSCLSSITVF